MMIRHAVAAILLLSGCTATPALADTPLDREKVVFDIASVICPAAFEVVLIDPNADMTRIAQNYARDHGLMPTEQLQVLRYCLMWLRGNDHGLSALDS